MILKSYGMNTLRHTAQFKTDLKRLARSGRYKVSDLLQTVEILLQHQPLPPRFKDHSLTGSWSNHRECHIKPDWLLIYRYESSRLVLVRTGSHSDLF